MDSLRVQKKQCKTCIYRKDSPLDLALLEAVIQDPYGFFTNYRACHHAKDGMIVCAGFWNKHKDEFLLGQMAQCLGRVEYVKVDDYASD